jgi:hypothetical protein
MIDFNKLIYAKLNIGYDKDAFIKEYDERILPKSKKVLNGEYLIKETSETNKQWGMVPEDLYVKADVRNNGVLKRNGYPSWDGFSLLYLDSEDKELSENSKGGSVSVRNYALDKMGEFKFFPEYEDLKIVEFIKQLPLTSLIGIRCVSLKENTFALIHRDNSYFLPTSMKTLEKQKMIDNFLWRSGFVQITLNLSNGGVPLYYGVTDDLDPKYETVDDDIYLFNDYFYHGVPLTSSRRRQIRITGRPTPELYEMIDQNLNLSF